MSSNIWEDIGVPKEEHPALKCKAELWNQILDKVEEQNLTQKQLMELWQTSQPNVSDIMRGKLDRFSIERLIKCLVALGLVEVVPNCRYDDKHRSFG